MTLSDVDDLYEYWREHPPVHELVAAFVGYKPPERKQYLSAEDLERDTGASADPFSAAARMWMKNSAENDAKRRKEQGREDAHSEIERNRRNTEALTQLFPSGVIRI